VEGEDADRSGVTEDDDASTSVCRNDFVELVARAIQKLAITLAARENVIEIAAKKCSVLVRVPLCGVFESQTFHYADAALAKRVGGVDWEMRKRRQWSGRFDSTREVARVDRRYRIVFEGFGGCGCLFSSTR